MDRGWLLIVYILAITSSYTIATDSEEVDDPVILKVSGDN